MSAPPDDPCPPPHTTGGAVDLSLIRAKSGEWLDMTSPFEMDETSAPGDTKGLSRRGAEEPASAVRGARSRPA